MIELGPIYPEGKKLYKYVSDYVIFDLETTGTSVKTDEIVEISAVKVFQEQIVDEFSMLVNPKRHIPYFATEVNGITDDMVKDCPTIDMVLPEFLTFIGEEILVGHNIHSFDMRFICRDAFFYLGKTIKNDYIDTVLLSRMLLPDMSHTLTNLASYYGISTEGAHRALNDCRMNQKVFVKLGKELQSNTPKLDLCPQCNSPLKLRNGKYGEFWGCTSYPNCRFTRDKK